MAAQVWDANLPPDWTCSVTSDGRIFFLNDFTKESSWLHPITKIGVQTGHRSVIDLPQGWERGVTNEGVPYFIDHNSQQTTLVHPITGRSDVLADAIQSSSPEPQRFDVSSPAFSLFSGSLPDSKKQASRKSNVGSWVKGPFLRRPDPSTITHQGWLLKQGSDGFQLWKRRWFVLSDYCLYYYKSPQEDKVLGYIPLPSFKIRPVCPEDRVFKRYAFKAEHANTRSYFFAAETKDQMTQWMNSLSLASILQKDTSLDEKCNNGIESNRRSDRPSISSHTSSNTPTTPSADDSDSGFHGYKSKRFLESKSPVIFETNQRTIDQPLLEIQSRSFDERSDSSRLTGDRLNISVDSCRGFRSGSRQPFYANAPPKPRRLNSSYEHSSTPDRSPLTEKKNFQQSPPEPSPVQSRKSTLNITSSERRTPEAYGATSTVCRGDYEDVYGGTYEAQYHKNQPHQRESFASSRSGGTRLSEDLNLSGYSQNQFNSPIPDHKEDSLPRNWHQAQRKPAGPPRPHSADFLEYDRKHGPSRMIAQRKRNGADVLIAHIQEPRPKSSVGYHHDGDFWSEENYAAKMRESAIYNKAYKHNSSRQGDHVNLSNRTSPTGFSPDSHHISCDTSQHPVGQRVPPAGAATPDLCIPQSTPQAHNSLARNAQAKSCSLKRGTDALTIQQYDDYFNQRSNFVTDRNNFLRSASARVTRNRLNDSLNTSVPDESPENDKKIQQREESMKRLLEWKQRMLQSPLTRKSSSRPDSSASSNASSKLNNSYLNNRSPQSHYESESYRQQVLKEITSQEMRTQYNACEQISNVKDSGHSSKRTPSSNGVVNSPLNGSSAGYSSQGDISRGVRPVPQGGSEDSNEFSSISLNGHRRREGKRDPSRTRHISGSESRRSASSSSRYNSYSSDEQDVVEERATRRKTRKTSRRNHLDQKPDSQQPVNSNCKSRTTSSLKAVNGCLDSSTAANDKDLKNYPSHDYVNINSLEKPVTITDKLHSSDNLNLLHKGGSERAVPVYIDDNDVWKREESKNIVFNDKYFAARDPYYVSDVQIPSISDTNLNEFGKEVTFGNRASPIGANSKLENNLPEPEYENTNMSLAMCKDERKIDQYFQVAQSQNNDMHIYSNSIDDNKNKQFDPSFQVSTDKLFQDLPKDTTGNTNYQNSTFQDDNSLGKYSDSGYDTLRAEIPQKKEDKRDSKSQLSNNDNNFEDFPAARKNSGKIPKRPETWSPDKFDRSWNNIDSISKVEESQIVKEYSYEYITPEKNKVSIENNLKDMSLNLKMSSPNLPSLESPRMVQETQQAASNRNLVKDRIKSFSSITEHNKPHEKLYLTNSDVDNFASNEEVNNVSISSTEQIKNCYNAFSYPDKSEVYESSMNEEFVSSVSTKTETQEAQVKILSDNINASNDGSNSCSELSSLEYKDLKSPQDIMDSRLTRHNIRKFIFDDSGKNGLTNDTSKLRCTDPQTAKNKKSVKELLKSFESKLENMQDNFNCPKEDYKRKFYSDSELLSNESSSDESDRDHFVDGDRLPPPPASFLEDLRKEANNGQGDDFSSFIPPPRPPKKVHLNCDTDSRGRPRSIRLSLAESIEESLRIRSESENEENGWYGTSTLKSNIRDSGRLCHNRLHVNNFQNNNTLVIDMDKPPQVKAPPPPTMSIEENYLPMSTPKKANHCGSSVGLSSSNSSLSSKHRPTPEPMYLDQFGKTEFEEHMYIEMSGEPSPKSKFDSSYLTELPKLDLSSHGNTNFLSPESPRYYEIGEKEGQHYEYIYKTGSQYEAIYMEVPNREKETPIEENKPEIPNKPHDLKHMKPFHKKCFSDSALISGFRYRNAKASDGSSDADDEASKDLDSVELPKKPRFSLSDTFRPASYYLSGADLSADIDAPDSSDSDLVSPPPIPVSLPPVEDLVSRENMKCKKYDYDNKETCNSPAHNNSFGSNSSKTLKYMPNDCKDFKITTPHYNHRRSDSGSIISNKFKRRPLLEETLDELNDDDNFILRSEDIYPSSIGYPDDRSSLIGKSSKGNSEMSLLLDDHNDVLRRPSSSLSLNMSFQNKQESAYFSGLQDEQIKERIYENGPLRHSASGSSIPGPYVTILGSSKMTRNRENVSNDFSGAFTKSCDNSFHDTSHISCTSSGGPVYNDQVVIDNQGHDAALQGNITSPSQNFHQKTPSELSNRSFTEMSNRSFTTPTNNFHRSNNSITPVHVRGSSSLSNNSETSPRTAPYYYSDVIRDESLPLFDESSHIPRTRAYQLNNQRDLEANKRQDIGRKVNQISNSLTMDITYRERLQNELRHSFDLFDGKTTGVPDERNVYEADTLRKMKTRTMTPDPENSTKNLYPYGISLKSDVPSSPGFSSHRRSRSLEGLVEDITPRQRKPIRDWLGSSDTAEVIDLLARNISEGSGNHVRDCQQANLSQNLQQMNSTSAYLSDSLNVDSPFQSFIPSRHQVSTPHQNNVPEIHQEGSRSQFSIPNRQQVRSPYQNNVPEIHQEGFPSQFSINDRRQVISPHQNNVPEIHQEGSQSQFSIPNRQQVRSPYQNNVPEIHQECSQSQFAIPNRQQVRSPYQNNVPEIHQEGFQSQFSIPNRQQVISPHQNNVTEIHQEGSLPQFSMHDRLQVRSTHQNNVSGRPQMGSPSQNYLSEGVQFSSPQQSDAIDSQQVGSPQICIPDRQFGRSPHQSYVPDGPLVATSPYSHPNRQGIISSFNNIPDLQVSSQKFPDGHISSPHRTYTLDIQKGNSTHQVCSPDRQETSSSQIYSNDRNVSSSHYDDNAEGSANDHVQYTSHYASSSSNHTNALPARNDQLSCQKRVVSPYADQSYQPPHNEKEISRDGSTSRLSHHETFSFESGEADNWEDDGQWREQLRRASLRHSRSLETLDEPRSRSNSDYAPSYQESNSPGKLSLHNESRRNDRVQSYQKSLDEYHVDYREGRIPPGNSQNEPFERTRKGLTTVEEYEWDAVEERFKKPKSLKNALHSVSTKQANENGQSFLAEGLPPSLEKDSEPTDMCKNLHTRSEKELGSSESHGASTNQYAVIELSSSGEGGRPLEDDISPASAEKECKDNYSLKCTQENQEFKRKTSTLMQGSLETNAAPDLIPSQDVTKLGEALHRRSDLGNQKMANSKFTMQSDSPLSNYSYGFGTTGYNNPNRQISQTYQPHPHANNPYHHYKSDDLLKYANHHPQLSQYPYANQEQTYNPTYQNYHTQPPTYGEYRANNAYDRLNSSPYNQVPSQELQDYYINSRNVDYGSYDQEFRETERLRQEEQMYQRQQELAYQQQYPDPEFAVDKQPGPSAHSLMTSMKRSAEEDALSSSKNFMSSVSAGELLGKTHEELVLLLIQLRRHQSALLAARRHTTLERDSQSRLAQLDNEHTEEHLQRIAYLEEHLQDLDKQYQMGKPLINLVDNMVKLGSLYRGFDSRANPQADPTMATYESPNQESLEFSRRILEKRILAEDRREYDSATPDQIDLEEKVMELYKLEKILQEESLTIQTLQREKDMLERTLETLHSRAQGTNENMVELERRNRQRDHLEKELSRLRSHLAVSARRLEETAVENNRLEHEMMMLRQKIQANMVRNAQRETEGTSEARHIESEMLRVQSLLEHLQKRRLELSQQIQRLTSTNNGNLDQRPSPTGVSDEGSFSSRRKHTTWLETDLDRMITRDRGCDPPLDKRGRSPAESLYSNSPVYSRGETNMSDYGKRSNYSNTEYSQTPISNHLSRGEPALRSESHYRVNLGDDLPVLSLSPSKNSVIDDDDLKSSTSYGSYGRGDDRLRSLSSTPLGRDMMMDRNAVDNKPDGEEQRTSPLNLDINEADDRMKRYYGILPKEKLLEPKTVRIVKRESTERKKDRYYPSDRVTPNAGEAKLSYVAEDELESDHSDIENYPHPMPDYSSQSASLPRNYGRANPLERANIMANTMRPPANHAHQPAVTSGAMTRPSNLPLRNKQPGAWKKNNAQKDRPMSAHEQLFGIRREEEQSPPLSPSKSDPPSPVFKSAAAREIIKEMAWEAEKHRRAVPKEKRRHFTISSSRPLSLETGSGPAEGARSRDDCDMVRALRPRNHPDVVKSTLSTRDVRFNESTIDTIFGAPRKIHIPERYIPDEDDEKELSKEEKLQREEKANAIRKMLTESSSTMTKPDSGAHEDGKSGNSQATGEASAPSKAKLDAEKKEREHMLAMNQILAKQVMEKSRMVAAHSSS